MSDILARFKEAITQTNYNSEKDLVNAIINIAEMNHWTLIDKEWGIHGFPELGVGDLAFRHPTNPLIDMIIEAKLVKTYPSKQEKVIEQAGYYGRLWSRLHPKQHVMAVAATESSVNYIPILPERIFITMAARRLSSSHSST